MYNTAIKGYGYLLLCASYHIQRAMFDITINILTRLSVQNINFLKFLLSLTSQKRLGYQENKYSACPKSLGAMLEYTYTAVSRKVVLQTRRTLRDNAESHYG